MPGRNNDKKLEISSMGHSLGPGYVTVGSSSDGSSSDGFSGGNGDS